MASVIKIIILNSGSILDRASSISVIYTALSVTKVISSLCILAKKYFIYLFIFVRLFICLFVYLFCYLFI